MNKCFIKWSIEAQDGINEEIFILLIVKIPIGFLVNQSITEQTPATLTSYQ